jgi:hypothetical protein
MNELRLDPESLSFTLVTKKSTACKACKEKDKALASFPFKKGLVRVYEIRDDVQPSKYELSGDFFKKSNADGYEEVLSENEGHEDKFKGYSAEEIESLFSILVNRVNELQPERTVELEPYNVGQNLTIVRNGGEHGFFDLFMLQVPKKEGKICFECESIKNVGDREVYKTENFIVYVPFAPKKDFELVISPKKHLSFKRCDPVLLFDLAGALKRVLEMNNKKMTWAIIQGGEGHFKIKMFEGEVDPYEILGINRIDTNPDVLAKELRDAKKI